MWYRCKLRSSIVTLLVLMALLAPCLAHAELAYDADSGVTGTGTLSWTHTPIATPPRCAVLYVGSLASGTDGVNTATYGGVSMTEIPANSPLNKATGENMSVSVFLLGAAIPAGAQTVSVTVNNASTKRAQVFTFSGEEDCEYVASTTISSDAVANPSTTLALGSQVSLAMLGAMSGSDAVVTQNSPTAGWTSQAELDLGDAGFIGYTYNTVGSSDVTVGWTQASQDAVMVAVAIKEITSTATHFVTSNGNASSNCTVGDPCTLTRAVTLINNSTIDDGAVVELAAGAYGQATLNITGSGSVGQPITLRGATLDGTSYTFPGRQAVTHTDWSLTAGQTYTYELVFDEGAAGWTPSNVVQNRPTNWQNIRIQDTNGVYFELTKPPRYKVQTSIATVEAQHCSSWFDAAANRMYVHLCDDAAPAAAHNLWLASTSYGSIDVDGDYITIDGIGMDATSNGGYGLIADSTSDNFIGRNIDFNASGFNGQGTNGLLDYAHFQSTGQQGPPTGSTCDSGNVSSFVGTCFNDSGTSTTLVLDDLGPWTVSNSVIEKGWNGISCGGTGTVTITGNTIRGFPNHPLGCEGSGRTITYNTVLNVQETFFTNIDTSNMDNVVLEHNALLGTSLMWGLGTNSNWTVRYNIARRFRVDNTTEATGTFDCNLYFQPDSDSIIFDRGGTGDATQADYTTVAQIQAGTAFEDNGLHLAASKMTDGTQFTLFVDAKSPYDLFPVTGAQAINMPAPCGTFAGPYNLATVAPGAPGSVTVTAKPATPTIKSLTPSSAAVGASVTITGSGFASSQGAGTVTFNGTPVTSYTSWSALSIIVLVPSGATTGNVVVNQNGMASTGVSFTVN